MAFVDIAAQAPNVSVQLALRFADRLAALVGSTLHDENSVEIEDDVFTSHRMGAAQLPAIDLCETTIFQQLRDREEQMNRTVGKKFEELPSAQAVGLNARIGSLFRVH